jgi:hypothetical protein
MKMTPKEITEWKRLRRLWMRGVATINQINRARALSRRAQNLAAERRKPGFSESLTQDSVRGEHDR